jgi:hypothetical protein
MHSYRKIFKPLSVMVFALNLTFSLYATSPTIEEREKVRFTPPQLDSENMGEKITCIRPVYKGSLDLALESFDKKKYVITTSGFGGSGITLGEGAVKHQIDDFEKRILPNLPKNKDTEITVVGLGWIGSLTTLELKERGYKNVTVITDKIEGLTSHKAGGLISHACMDNNPECQRLVDQFSIDTYKSYQKAIEGSHPFINDEGGMAVRKIPFFRSHVSEGQEIYVNAGLMGAPINVTLEMEDSGLSHPMVCYEGSIFVNTPSVLSQFHGHIKNKYGVPIIQKEIKSFEEIWSTVIFNCTGIRAAYIKERNGQKEDYIPALGHLIMGRNQDFSRGDLHVGNSMISFSVEQQPTMDLEHECTDSLYCFPKYYNDNQFVLGGTFIKNVGIDSEGVVLGKHFYSEKFDLIWDNAQKFFGLK